MSDLMLDDAPPPAAIRGRSLWDDAWRRLMRNPAAVTSLYVVAILVLIAIFGPFLWVHPYDKIFENDVAIAPTFRDMHLLGTDTEGRDMVARLILGLGISLLVGLSATIVALTIGVAWGAIAGFLGGAVDEGMMRLVDVLYAIPFVFFVIVLMTVVQFDDPVLNLVLIFCAIGAVEWLTMARIVRGQTIALPKPFPCALPLLTCAHRPLSLPCALLPRSGISSSIFQDLSLQPTWRRKFISLRL